MGNYRELWPTYADWKTARTNLAGNTYVITSDNQYIGVLVHQAEQVVHAVRIIRDSHDPNLADFESTVLGTAIAKATIESAITDEIA